VKPSAIFLFLKEKGLWAGAKSGFKRIFNKVKNMKKIVFALLAIIAIANADFLIENVAVTIYDIKPDGTAKVSESVKLIIRGADSQNDYDNGFTNNDISFWSSVTKLPDVKYHVNPAVVAIKDLRVLPQPRKKCNPLQEICHGELLIQYETTPLYKNGTIAPNTGLFAIEKSKPRTVIYKLNPEGLSFITTPQGHILLAENVELIIQMPENARLLELMPQPEGFVNSPYTREIRWKDTILVNPTVTFEVEESLEKEVSDFFYGAYSYFYNTLTGEYGWALIAVLATIIIGYVYITLEKKERARE